MDYFELLNKAENINKLTKENEELKRKLAEAEQSAQPTLSIESTVVQAFRQSPEYLSLEMQAFNSFLQEKFIKEFQRSPQAEQLVKAAQECFKIFEENYSKTDKQATKTPVKAKKEETDNEK